MRLKFNFTNKRESTKPLLIVGVAFVAAVRFVDGQPFYRETNLSTTCDCAHLPKRSRESIGAAAGKDPRARTLVGALPTHEAGYTLSVGRQIKTRMQGYICTSLARVQKTA
jgi:hypothetical protein